MIDCQVIKQGAMFYIPDMSGDTNAIFTGEHYPKKCRPWIVVSNDVANGHNTRICVVPVYTRNRLSIPTDVYFTNGTRDCVACCNQVISIEADKIDTRGYVGTVSVDILNQIKKALCIQFGIVMTSTETDVNTEKTNVTTESITIDTDKIVTDVLNKLAVESIVSKELVKLLITTNINATANISLSNILPVLPIKDVINTINTTTENNNDITATNNNVSEVCDTIHKETTDKRKSVSCTKTTKHKPHGKIMTLDQCVEFCVDVKTMTFEELTTKWTDYGLKDADKNYVYKKKYSIEKRLMKEGIPLP